MSFEPRQVVFRALRVVGLVLLTLVATATARTLVESRQEYARAQDALALGDEPSAVLHLRRAAQWYAPCCTRTRAALEELIAIGDRAAAEDRVEDALFAWRSARNAIFAARHLVLPNQDLLAQLHPRIAEGMARQVSFPEGSAERWQAQLDAWRDRRANLPLAVAGGLAFWASLGCFAWAFLAGLDAQGRRRPPFVRWLLAGLALSALWMLLVYLA